MTFLTLPCSSSSHPWLLKPSCIIHPTLPWSSLSFSTKPHISVFVTINSNTQHLAPCSAARQQQQQPKESSKRQTGSKKKRGSSKPVDAPPAGFGFGLDEDGKKKRGSSKPVDDDDVRLATTTTMSRSYPPPPVSIPNPPAGFVLDKDGKVLMVSPKRIVTIVDSSNNLPLECIIRRVFKSSQGDDCMLLCPVDTPVQILKSTNMKSTNIDGLSAVSDEEVEAILPAAAYALAKIHMHLVYSGFCYTARGGFCYSEEDIFEFGTDDGEDVDGLPTEGVQITCFHQDGTQYLIYTPSDPLLFVAVKDDNGLLRIADDDLLEDPTIGDAIDEETEFNALVEEEAALLESMFEEEL